MDIRNIATSAWTWINKQLPWNVPFNEGVRKMPQNLAGTALTAMGQEVVKTLSVTSEESQQIRSAVQRGGLLSYYKECATKIDEHSDTGGGTGAIYRAQKGLEDAKEVIRIFEGIIPILEEKFPPDFDLGVIVSIKQQAGVLTPQTFIDWIKQQSREVDAMRMDPNVLIFSKNIGQLNDFFEDGYRGSRRSLRDIYHSLYGHSDSGEIYQKRRDDLIRQINDPSQHEELVKQLIQKGGRGGSYELKPEFAARWATKFMPHEKTIHEASIPHLFPDATFYQRWPDGRYFMPVHEKNENIEKAIKTLLALTDSEHKPEEPLFIQSSMPELVPYYLTLTTQQFRSLRRDELRCVYFSGERWSVNLGELSESMHIIREFLAQQKNWLATNPEVTTGAQMYDLDGLAKYCVTPPVLPQPDKPSR